MAIEIRDAKPLKRIAATLLLLGALHWLNARYGGEFWLNLTDSEPIGLYRVYPADREIRRGELIVMEVPLEFRHYIYGRGWLPEGWALFKHVGTVTGDTYCVTGAWLTANGKSVGAGLRRPTRRDDLSRSCPAEFQQPAKPIATFE